VLNGDLVNLISAGYAAFLQSARTPDSVITHRGRTAESRRLIQAGRTPDLIIAPSVGFIAVQAP
jgi:hypothetical protein